MEEQLLQQIVIGLLIGFMYSLIAIGLTVLGLSGLMFSHLNLRGHRFPLWTSAMGLGRHPLRPLTWLADLAAGAGGEYWNTYFPQPAFLSTRGYGCLLETGSYSVLDFTQPERHRIEVLGEAQAKFFHGRDLKELIGKQSARLGIMPAPPDWASGSLALEYVYTICRDRSLIWLRKLVCRPL